MRLQKIINTSNLKNLLKPLTLARFILIMATLSISTYAIIYSTPENISSMIRLNSITQIIMGAVFLVRGIEEIKKPNGKKINAYLAFGTAFILTVSSIWMYVH